MANEAALLKLSERMAKEHSECEQWAHKPERARAERIWKLRMRALMSARPASEDI
jgi:hypothetical protein